jgi:hypothetical protein
VASSGAKVRIQPGNRPKGTGERAGHRPGQHRGGDLGSALPIRTTSRSHSFSTGGKRAADGRRRRVSPAGRSPGQPRAADTRRLAPATAPPALRGRRSHRATCRRPHAARDWPGTGRRDRGGTQRRGGMAAVRSGSGGRT